MSSFPESTKKKPVTHRPLKLFFSVIFIFPLYTSCLYEYEKKDVFYRSVVQTTQIIIEPFIKKMVSACPEIATQLISCEEIKSSAIHVTSTTLRQVPSNWIS